jgi:hypothetical protein
VALQRKRCHGDAEMPSISVIYLRFSLSVSTIINTEMIDIEKKQEVLFIAALQMSMPTI